MILYLGRRTFRGTDPKTKYWEFVGELRGDGVYRKDVFVEWWLGQEALHARQHQDDLQEQAAAGDLHGNARAGGKGNGLGLVQVLRQLSV